MSAVIMKIMKFIYYFIKPNSSPLNAAWPFEYVSIILIEKKLSF